jgi:hypothetical protein
MSIVTTTGSVTIMSAMSALASVEQQLLVVEQQLRVIEQQIADVEQQLKSAIGEDKAYLRKKEEQLRKKEEQLNDRINILMKQRQEQSDTVLALKFEELRIEQREAAERQEQAQREAAERQEQAQRELKSLLQKGSPTPTQNPALVGSKALSKLRESQAITRIPVEEGSAAVLEEEKVDDAIVTQLAQSKNENVVVALLMPLLRAVFQDSGRLIANSEDFEWPAIEDASPRKPDFVIALPQFLRKKVWKPSHKTSSSVVEARASDDGLIFGVPASASISGDAVHEVEAKTDIGTPDGDTGNVGLGELKNYMLARIAAMNQSRWTEKRPLPNFIRSMLVGRKYFWLVMMDTEGGTLTRVQWGEWTDPGSADAIRRFFPLLDWESAVAGVFDQLTDHGVATYDQFNAGSDEPDSAVLGQGGMGRVFRASMRDCQVAVKIVLPAQAEQLETEFNTLKKLESRSLPLVKPCSEFIYGKSFGAGYALLPVGKRSLEGKLGTDQVLAAFHSLLELHTNGVVHGDARLANLLQDEDGKLIWTDVASANLVPGKIGYRRDIETLIQSCCSVESVALGSGVDVLLSNYSSSVTSAAGNVEHCIQLIRPIVDLVIAWLKSN